MPIDYGTNNVSSSGNISVSGIVTAISGVFTNLTFNGTVVSISGHTHTASSITDFNEAVDDRIGSGLFVAGTGINLNYNDGSNSFTVSVTGLINNPTNNRILTSRNSTTTGIDAESNLTFDGSTLTCSGAAVIGLSHKLDIDNDFVNIRNQNSSLLLGTEELSLYDSHEQVSMGWGGRILHDSSGNAILYWSNPALVDINTNLDVNGSGNFASGLFVNNVPVSVSGHAHSSSNITDFNSSVSGLLPTISNSGDNRVLTSTGSALGINGESNLTFDGNLLNITGSGAFSSNLTLNNQTASTIAGFDGNKNITSLATGTYPSLTELSYVKGVTSALQTQLNAKQNTLTNPVTGTGAANHIAYWTSSSGIAHDASQLFWDATNNRLGVGTASPSGTLNVIGTGLFSTTTGIIPNALLDLYSATSGDMVFNVEGTNGSLFSVIDNLSGTLMSVNNNAGLPVFEVFSDDRVIGGRYNQNDFVISSGGNVGIGTASPTSKLHVIGTGNFSQNVLVNGISVRNTTLSFFTAIDNQPPASGFATLDTRNSIAVLDFDDTTEESAVFVGVVPDNANLASGLSVRIHWMATTATSGNCRWGIQFEDMNTDEDADSFDTATEAHSATNGTAGIPTTTTITCTTIDSLVAGDFFRIKIYRDVSDTTNDTMTGDAELIAVEVRSVL
jgi:hypothetical protein